MSANYAILGFLADGPNYGYELKKQYDSYFGKDKPILAGQVYSTLSRLRRDEKIVEIINQSESGGPERVQYAITDKGKKDLQVWLNTAEAPSPTLQTTLYIKTVLALIKDGNAAPYLDNQRCAHIQRMRQLTNQRREASLPDKLLIDHALFHLEADLRWIELASSRLSKLKEELMDSQQQQYQEKIALKGGDNE